MPDAMGNPLPGDPGYVEGFKNPPQRELDATPTPGELQDGTAEGSAGNYTQRAKDAFKDYFGTASGPKAGQAMMQKQAVQYMRRPESFGMSEAEKQAAADKAAAAAAAGTAGALASGAREMMGGGTTGYAAQAMRQATAPTRQGAASASQQAAEASKQMIEAKGQQLYGELTGKPYMSVAGQIAAAAGQQAIESGVDLMAEYAGQQLLGDPDGDIYTGVNAKDVDDMTPAERAAGGFE